MKHYWSFLLTAVITVFEYPNCVYCFKAKETLKYFQIPYRTVEISRDSSNPARLALIKKIKQHNPNLTTFTAPQIIIEGTKTEYVGGYNALQEKIVNKELFTILDRNKIPYKK